MSRRLKPVAGGARAPGCRVKGCATQPRRGTALCTVHAQLLRDIAAGSVRRTTPADPGSAVSDAHSGPAGTDPLPPPLDKLSSAVAVMDSWASMQVTGAILTQLRRTDLQPQTRSVLTALHQVVHVGGHEHLAHLVSVLEVCGATTRLAIQLLGGGGDHPVWTALRDLCVAVDQARTSES